MFGTSAQNMAAFTFRTAQQTIAAATGAVAVNLDLGAYIKATSTGPTTWTFDALASAQAVPFTMVLRNGGSFPQAWTNVKWANATAPTLSIVGYDVLGFIVESDTVIRGYIISLDNR